MTKMLLLPAAAVVLLVTFAFTAIVWSTYLLVNGRRQPNFAIQETMQDTTSALVFGSYLHVMEPIHHTLQYQHVNNLSHLWISSSKLGLPCMQRATRSDVCWSASSAGNTEGLQGDIRACLMMIVIQTFVLCCTSDCIPWACCSVFVLIHNIIHEPRWVSSAQTLSVHTMSWFSPMRGLILLECQGWLMQADVVMLIL